MPQAPAKIRLTIRKAEVLFRKHRFMTALFFPLQQKRATYVAVQCVCRACLGICSSTLETTHLVAKELGAFRIFGVCLGNFVCLQAA